MKHHNIRTESVCLDWIKRYILFHHKTHPAQMGAPELEAFLSHLAVAGKVAFDPKSGKERAAVSLSQSVGAGVAMAGQ
ncbi:phage integrase N-terminal SAM-like domain-containing protein [Candidatus Nitrotoga sp. 1052]|uniref:phage integrase N-terminal SAM-like domain-containing protein n=1 Tax=Candidatus Nitrotoga sp. 1052 TaxID=2886964 RepID=UPI001F9E5101|nr:phage integrase N-terminal SAM-like domain-containing protein [Candidatus Nitrotoga sp. 1052]CAH1074591.1 hypothetical protein NTG1052_220029 [Candidatus Nitrotoga sp. 1052]